jgi:hypothetical protein
MNKRSIWRLVMPSVSSPENFPPGFALEEGPGPRETPEPDKVAPPDLALDLLSVQTSSLVLARSYGKCIAEAAGRGRDDVVALLRTRLEDLIDGLEKESEHMEDFCRVLLAQSGDDLGGTRTSDTKATPTPGKKPGGGMQ